MKKNIYILLLLISSCGATYAQDPTPSSPTAISPNFTWYKKVTGGDTAYYGYSDGIWSNFARRNWVKGFGDNRYSLNDFSNVVSNARIKNNFNLLGQQYQVQHRAGFDATQFSTNNASSYLLLPDSLNQGVHPDIYYNPSGWNGYKFWMVYEPYENGNISLENPYLIVSNDGVTFTLPTGITNPVFPVIPGTHNSDADIYEGLDGKLWMTNRRNGPTADTLLVKSSSNGTAWSNETVIATGSFASLLSPTTVLENGIYSMWYVDNTTSPATLKFKTSSTPNGTYSSSTTCTINNMPAGYSLWHNDVLKINEQYILIAAMNNNSLGSLYNTRLFVATSYDGITWDMNPNFILGPKAGNWDNSKVYRSTAFILDKGEERKLGMYYSAYDSTHAVHVGYTEVTLGNNNIQNQNNNIQTGNYKISGHASSEDVSVTGTGGLGFIDLPLQSSPPVTSTTSLRVTAGSINNVMRIHGQSGFDLNFNFTSFTSSRSMRFPNLSNVTVGTIDGGQTYTNAIWNGTKIGLVYGGTNTDLSTTGGSANYLKQSSMGANITVGTIPYTDLTGTPSSLPPSGAAGGDLSGTYPSPTINTINSITKSFYDPSSSIQTQLNGKQVSGNYLTGAHTIFTPITGDTVVLVNNNYNIINPTGTLATLTLQLPSSPGNNDVIWVRFTQAVTSVTFTNGIVQSLAPSGNSSFPKQLVYDSGTSKWY